MKSFSLGKVALFLGAFLSVGAHARTSGIDLVQVIKQTALKDGVHVIPQTSKIRVWPICNGKLNANPIKSKWEAAKVECWDEEGLAWHAVIRTKIVGRIPSLQQSLTNHSDHFLNDEPQIEKPQVRSQYEMLLKELKNKRAKKKKRTTPKNSRVQKSIKVVKFRIPMKANTVIRETDLYLDTVSRINGQLSFADKKDVIGRKTRSHVAANLMVAPRHLHTRWDIYKGDGVTIFKTVGPIRISSTGTALSHAQIGGRIAVKNKVSGRVLTGVLEKTKKVRIFSKQTF